MGNLSIPALTYNRRVETATRAIEEFLKDQEIVELLNSGKFRKGIYSWYENVPEEIKHVQALTPEKIDYFVAAFDDLIDNHKHLKGLDARMSMVLKFREAVAPELKILKAHASWVISNALETTKTPKDLESETVPADALIPYMD